MTAESVFVFYMLTIIVLEHCIIIFIYYIIILCIRDNTPVVTVMYVRGTGCDATTARCV